MSNIWTDKELSEVDDITFAMSVLVEHRKLYTRASSYERKLASAYRTLEALRGEPIKITYDDMLSILRKSELKTPCEEILEESDEKVAFRVVYATTPVRYLAVRCPHCESWMRIQQATSDHIPDMIVAEFARYECTKCGHKFCPAELGEIEAEECDSADLVYRDCV